MNPIFISKEIVAYECYCKRKRLSALAKILLPPCTLIHSYGRA